MDADSLRLILLALGILAILGIYVWDRRKRRRKRKQALTRNDYSKSSGPASESHSSDISQSMQPEDLEPDPGQMDRELHQLGEILSEERQSADPIGEKRSASSATSQERRQAPANQPNLFDRAIEENGNQQPVAMDAAVPTKLLQINVVAKRGGFKGKEIIKAAEETGLIVSQMIFQRFADQSRSQALFSMASMLEPGIFPFDDMSGFTTPGLALFAQLPVPADGLAVYSDMLFTAKRLAELLGGELQDGARSALTKQTVEHTRAEILEHRRQLELARKKQ